MYVTNLQPGELEDDALVRRLFDGEYVIERVQSAVVLHDDPELPFDRVGRSAYYYKRAKGKVIDLDGIVVGRAFKQDAKRRMAQFDGVALVFYIYQGGLRPFVKNSCVIVHEGVIQIGLFIRTMKMR